MRTWTSFPPSLWPPRRAPAVGAVLGTLSPVPSNRQAPKWALLAVPMEPFGLFIGHRLQWELLSAPESLEVLAWEVSYLQLPLTWCFSGQRPPPG